mgnify:CR=1 FL=1
MFLKQIFQFFNILLTNKTVNIFRNRLMSFTFDDQEARNCYVDFRLRKSVRVDCRRNCNNQYEDKSSHVTRQIENIIDYSSVVNSFHP